MLLSNLLNASIGRKRAAAFAVLTLAVLLFGSTPSIRAARAGDLDPTFGSGGKILLPSGETNPGSLADPAIQPDGKIVALGAIRTGDIFSPVYKSVLVRLNADGTFDTNFGNNGRVLPTINDRVINGCASALQTNGKIVLACNGAPTNQTTPRYLTVFRYNADGSADASFGTAGSGYVQMLVADFVGYVSDVVVQADGKIIAGSSVYQIANGGAPMILVRYNVDGSLDNSFDGDGIFYTPTPVGRYDTLASILLKSDGKLVVTGNADAINGRGFVLFGLNADGSADASFGTNGVVITNLANDDHYGGAAQLQPDGKIVLYGIVGTGVPQLRYFLLRYQPNGSLDASFGTNGVVTMPSVSGQYDRFRSFTIQPDGKILLTGSRSDSSFSTSIVVVARVNTNGSPDLSFGVGGTVVTANFGAPGNSVANNVAVQPDGKILIVGYNIHDKYSVNPILARYLNNAPRDFDFDGDGKADVSIFRPSTAAEWYWLNSANNQSSGIQFGIASDKPAPADFDGDGKTDVSVFRDGDWYRLNSSNNSFVAAHFGQTGDIPVPADYDADDKADLAVYRAGNWYILNSASDSFRAEQFGIASDKPVTADYDGDGKADLAVYRAAEGTWYVQQSRDGFFGVQFGISSDKPVAADYDGDGKTDVAVYRPADGTWYLLRSNLGFTAAQFGASTDKPVPADYDGDGKTDLAVYRDGNWYLLRSTAGFTATQFGTASDQPVPNAFVP
ncbi:MAG TPA: FG-GAP-like repeat-containing protein [Pyrinomonadaceae bacterium]|jgi:uncharacterized delta-60 repeat protein